MGRNPDWDAIMCFAITNCKNPGPINKTGLSAGVSGLSSTEDEDDEPNEDEGPHPWRLGRASVDVVRVVVVVVVENPSTRTTAGKEEAQTIATTNPNTSRPKNDADDDDSGGPILLAFPFSFLFSCWMM